MASDWEQRLDQLLILYVSITLKIEEMHSADIHQLHKNTHTILGTVVVVCLIIQPFIGLGHHLRYKKTQQRGIWTLIHRWYGRALILLGMINGGLGLRLANNTTGGKIAYSVIAGISGCAFLGLIVWSEMQNSASGKSRKTDSQLRPNGDENENKAVA